MSLSCCFKSFNDQKIYIYKKINNCIIVIKYVLIVHRGLR